MYVYIYIWIQLSVLLLTSDDFPAATSPSAGDLTNFPVALSKLKPFIWSRLIDLVLS